MSSQNTKIKIKQLKTKNLAMRVKPSYRSISSLTQRPRQQIHPQLEGHDKQKNKKQNKTKSLQVAVGEYGIVNIPS
jgi:hypothetical protein